MRWDGMQGQDRLPYPDTDYWALADTTATVPVSAQDQPIAWTCDMTRGIRSTMAIAQLLKISLSPGFDLSGDAYTAFAPDPPLFFGCTTGPSRCQGGEKGLDQQCMPGTH
jgi:hypothetical protein